MNHSIKGKRLKRISLNIRNAKHPEWSATGQAVVQDVGVERFYFFASQKFNLDEEFEITCEYEGERILFLITIDHIHEQISSGKIMSALPTEGLPFPTRKFYRCFAKVKFRKVLSGPRSIVNDEHAKTEAAAAAAGMIAEVQATPIAA